MKSIKKKPSVGAMKKRCDWLFSRKIRLQHANDQGMEPCYTCGRVMFWTDAQCGHFVSRQYNSLRYDERNSKPQCSNCNVWRRGNYSSYSAHLVRDDGPEILEWFETRRKETKQYSVKELLDLEETLKGEVAELLKHIPESMV